MAPPFYRTKRAMGSTLISNSAAKVAPGATVLSPWPVWRAPPGAVQGSTQTKSRPVSVHTTSVVKEGLQGPRRRSG
ncbi:hypothetical protein [Vitiosangium sp. GDMCC 1.1324]|uniref:hypothetical protein n=1 Tax=Vitiosangium sp. (strain GDMCC 1.1324) TaxID=2138576 RepID=UPI00130E3038